MSQVRHHAIMVQNERILKEEVLRLQESLDNANNLVAAEANKQGQESEKLNKSIEDLKASKTAVEDDLKKEKASSEVSKGSIEELK